MTEIYRDYNIEIKSVPTPTEQSVEWIAVITCPDGRTCSSRKDPQIDQESALTWAHDWIDEQEDVIKPQNLSDC